MKETSQPPDLFSFDCGNGVMSLDEVDAINKARFYEDCKPIGIVCLYYLRYPDDRPKTPACELPRPQPGNRALIPAGLSIAHGNRPAASGFCAPDTAPSNSGNGAAARAAPPATGR
jgi:hypothetical protein